MKRFCKHCGGIDEGGDGYVYTRGKVTHGYSGAGLEVRACAGRCGDEGSEKGFLSVSIEGDWNEHVAYSVGGLEGKVVVPTGIDDVVMLEVGYCPWCGRKL